MRAGKALWNHTINFVLWWVSDDVGLKASQTTPQLAGAQHCSKRSERRSSCTHGCNRRQRIFSWSLCLAITRWALITRSSRAELLVACPHRPQTTMRVMSACDAPVVMFLLESLCLDATMKV